MLELPSPGIHPTAFFATRLFARSARRDDKPIPPSRMVPRPKTRRIAHRRDYSLARLQKDNKEITRQMPPISQTPSSRSQAQHYRAWHSWRPSAIPALEALLKTDDLSIVMAPMIKGQIARLKKPAEESPGSSRCEEAKNLPKVARRKGLHRPRLENSNASSRNERAPQAMESRLPPRKVPVQCCPVARWNRSEAVRNQKFSFFL